MARRRLERIAGAASLCGLALYLFRALAACPAACTLDLTALHGRTAGPFELVDVKLNMWILAWVQHALALQPLDLFRANAFYPAPDALAGSEHMLGLAISTWPLRALSNDAVFVYHGTLVLSCLVLGFTTWAFVEWITQSSLAGIAAGAAALFMPWRIAELSHLQLLAAHWFPLIWMLALQILSEPIRRRRLWGFAGLLTLQLLSSFYLAYMLTASLAAIAAVALLLRMASWRRLAAFLGAALPGYALLVLTSLPYLTRARSGGLSMVNQPQIVTRLDDLWRTFAYVAPAREWSFGGGFAARASYSTPLSILLFALIALWSAMSVAPSLPAIEVRRRRLAVLSLGAVAVTAFVLSLGWALEIGDIRIPLPGGWASELVPGFSKIRAPHRWNLVLGLALPVLAGVGLAESARRARRRLGATGSGTTWRPNAAVAGIVLTFVLFVPWRSLPTTAAWTSFRSDQGVYRALRGRPPAPVLELPWPTDELMRKAKDADYLLASTTHWRPILNGVTGYEPASHRMLNAIAAPLPRAGAFERLRRLADFGWIVVHAPLAPRRRALWLDAAPKLGLQLRYADAQSLLFEVPKDVETGRWMAGLTSLAPRQETLTGVSRAPLALSRPAGRLHVELLGELSAVAVAHVAVRVENWSDRSWPGLDDQVEGVVQIRYSFRDAHGRIAMAGLVPLYADIPAGGQLDLETSLLTPTGAGDYRLCVDLVQPLDAGLEPLPIEPAGIGVHVGGSPRIESETATDLRTRMLDAMQFANWQSPCGNAPESSRGESRREPE